MSEHRLEMSPERMINALKNEVRLRDVEIERMRKALEEISDPLCTAPYLVAMAALEGK